MPYVIPAMPLTCRIWTHFIPGTSTYAAPDQTVSCNLSPGKRVLSIIDSLRIYSSDGHTVFCMPMELLLPALTQVSAGNPNKTPSVIEVVPNSLRLYWCVYVDDIGKGFANEHRLAIMRMINESNLTFSDVTIACPPALLA